MSFAAVWRMSSRIWSSESEGARSACGFEEAASWANATRDMKATKMSRARRLCMYIITGFKPGWFRDVAHYGRPNPGYACALLPLCPFVSFVVVDVQMLEPQRAQRYTKDVIFQLPNSYFIRASLRQGFSQALRLEQSFIHAVQVFDHLWTEQLVMANVEKVVHD